MDILYFLGAIICMALGVYILYFLLKDPFNASGFFARNRFRVLFMAGVLLAFCGLFQAVHSFCLIFGITR